MNIMGSISLFLLLIYCVTVCLAFLPNFWSRVLTLSWNSYTHQYMTEQALLNVTMETINMMPEHFRGQEQVDLGRAFWKSVSEVVSANAEMDFLSSTRSDPVYHFDSEKVEESTAMLRDFWKQAVLLTQKKDYQGARYILGQVLHGLQDFYSHSNWVEMGQRTEYLHLLHPEEPAVPVASEDTPTCAPCHRYSCYNNILEDLVRGPPDPLLTTGYFSTYPAKPIGKCSHGGVLDSSRHQAAEGGINKDSTSPFFSPHHFLHNEAAQLASKATLRVLRDLRDEVGPKNFLRFLSVKQPPALVFVIDTTGSMFEEITAARLRVLSIIQARAKNQDPGLPGTFLLIPFHDPTVGPVLETDDPSEFQQFMENLMALGGGDEPEMCLSAVQLALIHSPPLSEIFVFTDASPKDSHLYSTVKALVLEKQSKVTFLLTEDPHQSDRMTRKRKRRATLSPDRFSLYSSLSSLSGGMTIFTTNKDIHKVSAIVEDSTTSSKVTLFHAVSEADSLHSFTVDQQVRSVRIHVAGKLTRCVLISPTGAHQSFFSETGPLGELDQSDGLYRIKLLPPVSSGQWHFNITSHGPITFNVLGESAMDFFYYFAAEANETHPGLRRLEGSPIAGVPAFLVVTVTGLATNDEATFSHVTLLESNGEYFQKVLLNSSNGSGEELIGFIESVPRKPFSVRLCGKDRRGNELERVSTEMVQPTHVHIMVLSTPQLLPGHHSTILYEVFNHGPARHFILTAEDDLGFLSHGKHHRLFIGERGSVREEVKLKTPHSTQAGQTLTVTLTVQAHDSPDSNYAVVYLLVLPEEPDTSPPSCSVVYMESNCPPLPQCFLGNWSVYLTVKDKGNSGLASIQLTEGQGSLMLLHEEGIGKSTNSLMQLSEETYVSRLKLHREEATRHQLHKHSGWIKPNAPKITEDRLVHGEPPLNISEWARRKHIMLYYISDCCGLQAELHVLDGAGNMRNCSLARSQQRALREKNCAANGLTHTLLTLALWTLLDTICA
ncbi:von Willebrand factor A domain-containing protein 7 isoform X1 [Tachysurus fulvidraco]|uniref:von Willebrand factor A domain-containing protein 7 isoform X1 n=1 Tax=Tachysurus fulvidraco TaxID=1234273 RepID=UPI001FF029BF|nr:von Willebrand factor A domain-containing protein 7 isoform X1 [Tachysurus fulvidraco]XP_047677964.1 von Willebrand factor A domain-containing protein 7 isoform X1 [Tachysurus fulvidraco]XP_047677965.1 von Willebrand factor A domain-containing protein 7 isoform X1 [Tachysurus fulvidraco]